MTMRDNRSGRDHRARGWMWALFLSGVLAVSPGCHGGSGGAATGTPSGTVGSPAGTGGGASDNGGASGEAGSGTGGAPSNTGGSTGGSGGTTGTGGTAGEVAASGVSLLGFVVDADGAAVPFATVGGAQAARDGVVTRGAEPAGDAGWYAVEADGYATTYARPMLRPGGVPLLSATLFPVAAQALVAATAADPVTVAVAPADGGAPPLAATVAPGSFAKDAVVALTPIPSTRLAAADAALAGVGDPGLHIRRPFEIHARAAVGGAELQPVKPVTVTLVDDGVAGDAPRLFRFDAAAGAWTEEPGACARTGATTLTCTLDHFSLHGVGGPAPSLPSGPPASYGEARAATRAAVRQAAEAMARKMRNGEEEEGDLCDLDTDAVVQAFVAEVDAALAYAATHPTEEAKRRLLATAGRLASLGLGSDGDCRASLPARWANGPDPEATIFDRIKEITHHLAQRVLQDPQCEDLPEVELVALEAELLGSTDRGDAPALEDAWTDLMQRCDVIQGRITYTIYWNHTQPLPIGDAFFEHGGEVWQESHDIDLVLHTANRAGLPEGVEPLTFEGTDQVATRFPAITYRHDFEAACPFPTFDRMTFAGVPDPGAPVAELWGRITAGAGRPILEPEDYTVDPVVRVEQREFETGIDMAGGLDNPHCVKAPDTNTTLSIVEDYGGQVVEQLADNQYLNGGGTREGYPFLDATGNGDAQLPTLWAILRGEPDHHMEASGAGGFPIDIWDGSEVLIDAFTPWATNAQVVMRWNLLHINYTRYQLPAAP